MREQRRSSFHVTYRVGRGREGHDGHVGKVPAKNAKLEVVRPEVVAPAVCGVCRAIIRVVSERRACRSRRKQKEGGARIFPAWLGAC